MSRRRKRYENPGQGLKKALEDIERASSAVVRAAARLADARARRAHYKRRLGGLEDGVLVDVAKAEKKASPSARRAVEEQVEALGEEIAPAPTKKRTKKGVIKTIDAVGGILVDLVDDVPSTEPKKKPNRVRIEKPSSGEAHPW